jgi:Fe2+ or Zn2+ uptake regulation protein
MSASEARVSRRLLRKQLRGAGARCAACSARVDERGHRAVWIDDSGYPHVHFVCNDCLRAAEASQEAADELATRCALALCEPKGRA